MFIIALLLSLLLLSCIVVPIKELANIHFSSSAFSSKPFQMANLPFYMDIDIDCNCVRRKSASSSKIDLREALILSNALSTLYHERIEMNNNLPDEDIWDPIDSSQLFYNKNIKVGRSVRKTTDNYLLKDSQHVQNEAPALKNIPNYKIRVYLIIILTCVPCRKLSIFSCLTM